MGDSVEVGRVATRRNKSANIQGLFIRLIVELAKIPVTTWTSEGNEATNSNTISVKELRVTIGINNGGKVR